MTWRARAAAAAFGAAAIGATGLVPAFAADPVGSIGNDLTKVTILNINDFHGRIGGSTGLNFACAVQQAKSAAGAGNYTFLSAGDNIGATPFVSSAQDDNPTIDFLNALELESTAVGNHEFDRGFSDLTGRVTERSDFSQLGANVYKRGTTTPALPEYYLTDINGVKVAVIGAVTDETPTLVSPTGVSMIDFGDPVAAVNRVAAQIADKADIIIAQYHEGATEGEPPSTLADELARGGVFERIVKETSNEVDAIFTGHTHKQYAWSGPTAQGTRPIIQSGSYAENLGVVELGVDPVTKTVKQYTHTNVKIADHNGACDADPAYVTARQIAESAQAYADEVGKKPIGKISADITTAFGVDDDGSSKRDDRLRESTLGNLTAQIWLEAMNTPGRPGADIGIMNPGGLRDELLYKASGDEGDGVVTYAEAAAIHPFANTMQTIDITGAQVKTLLEQQWQPAESSRPFLKLGLSDNVRYTYNPDASAGERITGVWVDGKPIDAAATYTVASGSFLIAGGDNFTVLQEGKNLRDSGLIDTDAFMNYFLKTDVVAPSFEKNGVAVTDIDLPLKAAAGQAVKLSVSGVDLTSLGSPSNTQFTVHVGDVKVGTAVITPEHIDGVPTRDGTSTVTFTVPANAASGATVITLKAEPSGTVVKLLATISAGSGKGPVIETDIPAEDTTLVGPVLALALMLSAAGLLLWRRHCAQH